MYVIYYLLFINKILCLCVGCLLNHVVGYNPRHDLDRSDLGILWIWGSEGSETPLIWTPPDGHPKSGDSGNWPISGPLRILGVWTPGSCQDPDPDPDRIWVQSEVISGVIQPDSMFLKLIEPFISCYLPWCNMIIIINNNTFYY